MADKIKLINPIMINGEKRAELEYDIDSITPEQYMNEEANMNYNNASNGRVMATQPEFNSSFHFLLGCRAIINCDSSIDIEDLKRVNGRDFNKIRIMGRDFFKDIAPEESQEETASTQKLSEDSSEDTVESTENLPKLLED